MGSQRIGVLFVCLGNICRSPMAEGIFRKLVRERGLQDAFDIDSCGTAGYHAGEGADPRSMGVLRRHGAGYDHTARQLRSEDFDRFDFIMAMDSSNLGALKRRCPPPHQTKLHKVLHDGGDVRDPYYGGPQGFEINYQELSEALEQWLDRML